MIRLAADAVALLHFGFLLFVAAGCLLVLRWPRLAWIHVPACIWGVWIELTGGICPLTPLEISLRRRVGEAGFGGGFIDHYLITLIYPPGLQRWHQVGLGMVVLLVNGFVYCINTLGKVVSFKASKSVPDEVHVYPLGEMSYASPAVSGGRMYLRTRSQLFSVGGR